MGMAENSKSVVGRKENKDILQVVKPNISLEAITKNAENAIFRTRDEGTSILGERYNAGNNCRRKEEREAPYAVDARQKCNWTLSK
jgi:hypothetical protein